MRWHRHLRGLIHNVGTRVEHNLGGNENYPDIVTHSLHSTGDSVALKLPYLNGPRPSYQFLQQLQISSDCGLQLTCMKSELLVTCGQSCGSELVSEPCTHHPSHYQSWPCPKSLPYAVEKLKARQWLLRLERSMQFLRE